mgnify:CR=1 FL=1
MNFRENRLALAVRGAVAFGLAIAAGGAMAQSTTNDNNADQGQAKQLKAVQVTGSAIRSVDYENAQPVFTMSSADIKKTGLTNVGDLLANLPIAGTQNFSKASTLSSNKEQGGQYVNLYNLGEQRTLVLVNGKRWMTSLSGLTDLSTIPVALIDHIDVLQDGASPIYGSDAVSGVVNIILKDHFNGAQLDTQIGMNQGGDGSTEMASFTVGTASKKGSIIFNANYNRTTPVWAKDRSWTDSMYGPNHVEDGLSSIGPWGRFTQNGTTYVLNHTGNYTGNGVGANSSSLANYHQGVGTNDYYNSTQQMMLQQPTELRSLFTSGTYNFTDNFRFKATGMYSERDTNDTVAGMPLQYATQPNYTVPISGQSVYNPTGQDITSWYRRITELQRQTRTSAKSFHFDASLEGEFELNSHDWHWDTGFNYNKWDASSQGSGNINLVALRKALGPSFINSAGVAQCGTAADPIALGTSLSAGQCTPFNILGGPSASNSAALSYINALTQSSQESLVKQYTANIGGGLFNLPYGEVQIAFGFEHRDVSGYDRPDSASSQGFTSDLAAMPTSGSYHTNEVYGELNIPVLADLPGAKKLNLDIQSRFSDYSAGIGSTVRTKYQFVYQPFDDLMFRGTYAQGFRAPTLMDTFGGGSQSFDYYTDPCDAKYGSTSDARVAAACHQAGLSSTFRQTDSAGNAVSAPNTQSNTPFQNGVGNSNLKPETSVTRSLGLVYSPSWVPGLNFNVDFYSIRIDNMISAVGANYILNQCYQQSSQSYCDRITRDSTTGQVTNVQEGNANLGWMSTSSYQFGFQYNVPKFDVAGRDIGRFQVTLDGNYLQSFKQQSSPDSDVVSYVGQWNYSRFRGTLGVNWSKGDWSAGWDARYYGSFRDQCWNTDPAEECSNPTYTNGSWGYDGYNHKGAIVYQDMNMSWAAPWNASISFGIRNLFARKPPVTYSVGNSSATYYDPMLDLDRYFFLQYSQKF